MTGLVNLSTDADWELVEAAAAAGQTELETDIVDLKGYNGVLFAVVTADVSDGSVITGTIEVGDAANLSDAADSDVTASYEAAATDADNKIMLFELIKPTKRYCRLELTRGTANAAIACIIAIKYRANNLPIGTQTDVIASSVALGG